MRDGMTMPPEPSRPELEPLLAVLFMMVDEMRSVVIHIVSTNRGEGTSTIAREIALAASAPGWCKVALIDASGAADGRPGLVEQFERGEEPELRTVGAVPAGVATARMSAVQGAARLESVRGLYAGLRARFNMVIVDCPPVMTGRQAAISASVADGTILVVEAERTRIDDASRARETLEQLGAKVLGVVFNKRRRRIPRLISRFI